MNVKFCRYSMLMNVNFLLDMARTIRTKRVLRGRYGDMLLRPIMTYKMNPSHSMEQHLSFLDDLFKVFENDDYAIQDFQRALALRNSIPDYWAKTWWNIFKNKYDFILTYSDLVSEFRDIYNRHYITSAIRRTNVLAIAPNLRNSRRTTLGRSDGGLFLQKAALDIVERVSYDVVPEPWCRVYNGEN